jgi:hypothetical protein
MQLLDWLSRFYHNDSRIPGLRGPESWTGDRRRSRAKRSRFRLESLEPRCLLADDFGDAPDTGSGTGAGNYETLVSNNGPSHRIVNGLLLGARVDLEANATQN